MASKTPFEAPDSTPAEVEAAFRTTRDYFRSGATRGYDWRVSQIKAVKALLNDNKDLIAAALFKDLRRGK